MFSSSPVQSTFSVSPVLSTLHTTLHALSEAVEQYVLAKSFCTRLDGSAGSIAQKSRSATTNTTHHGPCPGAFQRKQRWDHPLLLSHLHRWCPSVSSCRQSSLVSVQMTSPLS